MVSLSTSRRTEKQELLALHQAINWSIAGILALSSCCEFTYLAPMLFAFSFRYPSLHFAIDDCIVLKLKNLVTVKGLI